MNSRLALLEGVERDISQTEVFRLALLHTVAELGGLGGAVHLRGPMSVLRLVASSGLPPIDARSWEIVDQEGTEAPSLAVRGSRRVWAPYEAPFGPDAEPWVPAASGEASRRAGTGLAAVPVPGVDRPNGALTIVTQGPQPTCEQWDFMCAVAAWVQERIAAAPAPAGRPRGDAPGAGSMRGDLRAVQVGTWDWNINTGELLWDDAAMIVYGADPDTFVPHVESWMKIVHPDDLPSTLAAIEKAIRDVTIFEAEYRVLGPDGSQVWTQTRARLVLDEDGKPYRMIGRAWESNETPAARNTLSRVLRNMSDSFLALDHEGKIVFSNLPAERTLGFTDEELSGRVLWDLPAIQQMHDLEDRCRRAAAEGAPTEFDIEGPSGRLFHLRIVPVPDGITIFGTDVTNRRKEEAARAEARLHAADRANRTADLTAALAKATTPQDVVDAVAQWVLPAFAGSSVLVFTVENGRAHIIGARGVQTNLLDDLDGRRLGARDPISEVVATGAPVFVHSLQEHQAKYPQLAVTAQASGMNAYLPLTASGHTFGVCLIAFGRRHTTLSSEENTLLTAVSALVAHAMERARLYEAEHRRSHELQSRLLPKELPRLAECTTSARYLPAGQGMEVGGDWYDVIPLSGCRVAFVIGDVMGHGLAEAAAMGQLRTAVRTLAGFELPPDEIMSHLNDTIGELGADWYATCLYALYDSTDGRCSVVSAGHPPPAIVRPDGSVHFLDLVSDPPLGAAEPPFRTTEFAVSEESLLVFYTDGLVESLQRPIDQGLSELKQLLSNTRQPDLERLSDLIMAGLLPSDRPTADDSALLVARVHTLAADRIASWSLPDEPQAASQARRHVRAQLADWGLNELSPTTELLASELVGNVVRYAKGPMQLRMLRGKDLICEVSDGSLTMPRIRHASETDEGGRGLQLVAALSQRWGTRYTMTGKWIWTAQPVSGAEAGSAESDIVAFDVDRIPPL
ncbi:SpoIIE family protein phosphatase [Streptomyces sp. NPDC059262]|uniref:SpoIIE family protein phosphatase n=1 Tax=Streptomyces sp. NPDC059262 TaxID=3346797 RepID=UPI0036CE4464